jgi:RimJ/RimL family protein N-acetyltransferase
MVVPDASGMKAKRLPSFIRTERLTLERVQVGDEDDLAGIWSDEANLRYSDANPMAREDTEQWISSEASKGRFPKTDESCCCYFAIKKPKAIGFVPFWYDPTRFNVVDFGIVIDRNWQRKGYGIEAVRGLLCYSFENLGARRVVATCDSRNVAGRQLLLKAGMRQESERIEDRFIKGEWVNTVGFAILKREYAAMIGCR